MEAAPILHTGRLLLRPFAPDDVAAVLALLGDQQVTTYLPLFPLRTREEAAAYLQKQYLAPGRRDQAMRYAICLKGSGAPIGYVHVSLADGSHDFGYALRKEHWGRGIAAEAGRAALAQAEQMGVPYVTATHDVNNPRSGAVMRKLFMAYQYSYREQWQPKDIPVVFRMYQLNLDGQKDRVYRGYWDRYPEHFIEQGVF